MADVDVAAEDVLSCAHACPHPEAEIRAQAECACTTLQMII
jgi:hypothetical protein